MSRCLSPCFSICFISNSRYFASIFSERVLTPLFNLARNILSNQQLLIETEVFSSSLDEIFTAADDLPVEGVDDRVGFLEESVDSANFLKIELPFGGVLDDYAEIDVAITTADPPGDLLALTQKRDT